MRRTAPGSITAANCAFTDSSGSIIADQLDAQNYLDYIGESVQIGSYLKSPYYKPLGFSDGMYRVGPLARLNVCEQMGVPKADAELKKFKKLGHGAVTSSFLYHYARLIEILASLEYVERYLDDPELMSGDLRADAGINNLRGVGVSEAPRGTLFHDYTVDRNGLLQKVNLIVATGQNNLAMNQTVAQIARHYVRGKRNSRTDAQPRRARHPLLRPVLELFDARRRPDAAACPIDRAGRNGFGRNRARLKFLSGLGWTKKRRRGNVFGRFSAGKLL